jgi:hypothetical protein
MLALMSSNSRNHVSNEMGDGSLLYLQSCQPNGASSKTLRSTMKAWASHVEMEPPAPAAHG